MDNPLYHAPFEVHGIYLENKFCLLAILEKQLTNGIKYGTMNT